ncbi:MAG: response regulator [Betaproteobacteria bacterium]|nr:response regulator [Betaproteobacteria bacterium]MBK8108442.1 response regulator [Betaproteobacteria bacterium]
MVNTLPPESPHRHVVILVEDDEGLRVALLRLLRASGFSACGYASAEALLDDPRAAPADCLVVDVHLPAMSGLELVTRLRRRGLRVPAVAISAHDEAGVREAVRSGGVERFLGKPFPGRALVSAVDELIAAR